MAVASHIEHRPSWLQSGFVNSRLSNALITFPIVITARSRNRRNSIGNIDLEGNKCEGARPRLVHASGKNWLVVRGQVGSGSGHSLYDETFLKLNFPCLRKMSVSGSTDQRDWLRDFLKRCDNTPEKLALSIPLQDQLPESRKQR